MARIERSIEINRPAEEVFEYLTDLDRLSDWATSVVDTMDVPPKPLQAGQRFRQKIRVAGLPLDIECEVTAVDPPRSVEYRADAPGDGWAVMKQRVFPDGDHARVEVELDYDLPGGFLGEAVDRVYAERRNEREAEHSLANLKDLLEGRAPSNLS